MKEVPLFLILAVSACQRSHPETGKSGAAPRTTPLAAAVPSATASNDATTPGTLAYSFDRDREGAAPVDFVFARTGGGRPGRWLIQAETGARSGRNVLAQLDSDSTNFRFPLAVTAATQPADVRVSVSCRLISGKVDQACGLVVRYRDENNYLITRANALEDNVRLYTVKDGKRNELASHDIEVSLNVWHDYRFEARGDQLRVWWDDRLVLEHRDTTFVHAGSAGMWTKADSVTYFDDFRVDPLQ